MISSKSIREFLPFIAAAFSGLLLAIPYNYPDYFPLTWFAFAPLLVVFSKIQRMRSAYVAGLILGLVFYGVAASWITDFILLFKGYPKTAAVILSFVFWFYCAQLPALLFSIFYFFKSRNITHTFILFPTLVTLFYGFFPMLFSVQLGESQSRFLIALQAIELTGVYGLDFMIGLMNCVVASLVVYLTNFLVTYLSKPSVFQKPSDVIAITISSLILSGWFFYGIFSLSIWNERLDNAKYLTVGIVQPNEKPEAGIPLADNGFSYAYPPELALSENIVEWSKENNKPIDFILWPETRFKGYLRYPMIEQAFNRNIRALNTPVVFHDIERSQQTLNSEDNLSTTSLKRKTFSSVLLIDDQGRHTDTYQKIKRVPFGEYVPLVEDSPTIKQWFYQYFGEFFSDFSAGEGFNHFMLEANLSNGSLDAISDSVTSLQLVPLICYEVMLPTFVANAVSDMAELPVSDKPISGESISDKSLSEHSISEQSIPKLSIHKQATSEKTISKILLGLSNNGWFGESLQPYQHLNSSILRSVENRTPLLHAVNNGPSGVVSPTGQLLFLSSYHQRAAYVVDIPLVDSSSMNTSRTSATQTTFFSRHPYFFVYSIVGLLFLNLFAKMIFSRR